MAFIKDIPLYKKRLRADALAWRDAQEIDARLEWDHSICENALLIGSRRNGPTKFFGDGPVAGYWPMRSEADPRALLSGLSERGLPLCLPAIVDGGIVFRSWPMFGPLVPGGFGTLVPPAGSGIVTPTVVLVPLAAFDRRGHRIGYGKGHYDRALAALPTSLTIGIAYAGQEIDKVPDEAHDVPLDMVITEEEVIRI